MDRQPGNLGYLLLHEDGAVVSSSGDLENDERSADIIMALINLVSQIDPSGFPSDEASFKKLSLTYDNHCYVVCLSNRKVHIVKKSLGTSATTTTTTTTTGVVSDGLAVNV